MNAFRTGAISIPRLGACGRYQPIWSMITVSVMARISESEPRSNQSPTAPATSGRPAASRSDQRRVARVVDA